MGTYINLGNAGFKSARKREYVDKSGLISMINNTLGSEWRFSCVTRARRFGKHLDVVLATEDYFHTIIKLSIIISLIIGDYCLSLRRGYNISLKRYTTDDDGKPVCNKGLCQGHSGRIVRS